MIDINYVQTGDSFFTSLEQILQTAKYLKMRIDAAEITESNQQDDHYVIRPTTLPQDVEELIKSISNSIRDGYRIERYRPHIAEILKDCPVSYPCLQMLEVELILDTDRIRPGFKLFVGENYNKKLVVQNLPEPYGEGFRYLCRLMTNDPHEYFDPTFLKKGQELHIEELDHWNYWAWN